MLVIQTILHKMFVTPACFLRAELKLKPTLQDRHHDSCVLIQYLKGGRPIIFLIFAASHFREKETEAESV